MSALPSATAIPSPRVHGDDSIRRKPQLEERHRRMEDRLPRKLAAILYADVAGYPRLTGDDEAEPGRERYRRTQTLPAGIG